MEYKFIENPIVGKFYEVPCVRATACSNRFVAILPHKHADPQFGTTVGAKTHYHFDTRFFAKNDFQLFAYTDLKERSGHIHTLGRNAFWNYDEIRIEKRKCHRAFGGMLLTAKLPTEAVAWYKAQKGKSCAGRICPHFRQPMLERDGVLECPYHGLIGDIETEKIIGNIHGI